MEIPAKTITDMQRQVDACSAYIDALAQGGRSPEKVNALLDAAMQKIELCASTCGGCVKGYGLRSRRCGSGAPTTIRKKSMARSPIWIPAGWISDCLPCSRIAVCRAAPSTSPIPSPVCWTTFRRRAAICRCGTKPLPALWNSAGCRLRRI